MRLKLQLYMLYRLQQVAAAPSALAAENQSAPGTLVAVK
jgi:hypothetical protein